MCGGSLDDEDLGGDCGFPPFPTVVQAPDAVLVVDVDADIP